MSETVPPPLAGPYGTPEPVESRNRTLLIVLFAVGLIAALGLGYLGVRALTQSGPNPAPAPTGAAPSGWCYSVNGVPVGCDAPMTLEVLDRLITVQGQTPRDGAWHYFDGIKYPDYASWVEGTVVNYVLGIGTSPANDDLFNRIDSGTLLTLTLTSGTQMVYRFQSYTQVDRSNENQVFKQTQPALTLLLLGTPDQKKYVISCAWVASRRSGPPPGALPGVGATVPITASDMTAHVTLLSSTFLRDPTLGLPEGNGYFLVDFTVTYSGSEVLDTQSFNMVLVDADSQVWTPTGAAGPYGRYPQPVGLLQNGETITATLGYLVGDLPGNAVRWEVQLRPTDVQSVTFQIPFSAQPPGQAARAGATVTVGGVTLSADGNLVVSGSVSNPTGEMLTVQSGDITLTTGGGTSPLITANPPAPWQIGPQGQTPFSVTFLRPPTGTAIFSVLGRQFIISNIP